MSPKLYTRSLIYWEKGSKARDRWTSRIISSCEVEFRVECSINRMIIGLSVAGPILFKEQNSSIDYYYLTFTTQIHGSWLKQRRFLKNSKKLLVLTRLEKVKTNFLSGRWYTNGVNSTPLSPFPEVVNQPKSHQD